MEKKECEYCNKSIPKQGIDKHKQRCATNKNKSTITKPKFTTSASERKERERTRRIEERKKGRKKLIVDPLLKGLDKLPEFLKYARNTNNSDLKNICHLYLLCLFNEKRDELIKGQNSFPTNEKVFFSFFLTCHFYFHFHFYCFPQY